MDTLTRRKPTKAPSMEEARSWIGWRVDDLNGITIGQVEEVIPGEGDRAAWLVLGDFCLDGRRFAVPAADAVGGTGRVWSPHLRRQVRDSGALAGESFTQQVEAHLRAYYGRAA